MERVGKNGCTWRRTLPDGLIQYQKEKESLSNLLAHTSGHDSLYRSMLAYTGIEDAGILTAAGEENGSEAKLAEIRAFAEKL